MSKTSAQYIDDLDTFDDSASTETSEIAKFFEGCNVFITGATGFLGILVIEKLLRCCPAVAKLYILMRPKKSKTAQQRFHELFDADPFSVLKKKQPNFQAKVVMIEGDTSEKGLGLSEESRKIILDTNVLIHLAATVNFKEKIRKAVNINVRGIQEVVLLAKEMRNLRAFVHVSTAFSYCVYNEIEEKYYEPPMRPDDLIRLTEVLSDEQLELLSPTLIGKWPNVYTFTKAVGEEVVRLSSADLPVVLVRPPIVGVTMEDPIAGWTNSVNGVTGITLAVMCGVLRTMHCKANNKTEVVPADHVIASILAAAWDTGTTSHLHEPDKEFVYNVTTSHYNPISWNNLVNLASVEGYGIVTRKMLWLPSITMHSCYWAHEASIILFFFVPACIADAILIVLRRKPQVLQIYWKVRLFSKVVSFFATREWHCSNDHLLSLHAKLNSVDQKVFNCDTRTIDWGCYIRILIRGVRQYLLRDPLTEESVEAGQKVYRRMQAIQYTVIAFLILGFSWLFCKVFGFV